MTRSLLLPWYLGSNPSGVYLSCLRFWVGTFIGYGLGLLGLELGLLGLELGLLELGLVLHSILINMKMFMKMF